LSTTAILANKGIIAALSEIAVETAQKQLFVHHGRFKTGATPSRSWATFKVTPTLILAYFL
jgi:hypothetical protein